MKIAVYGANGYQGKLVVAELARQGIEPVLVGRSRERLRAAAGGLGVPDAELRVAAADDPAGFESAEAVINCAGPYSDSGETVARSAVAARRHYIDLSGEQLHIKRLFDVLAPEAERAGVTVVPAMTESGALDDLLAHLLADQLRPDEIILAHQTFGAGGLSRGSARSALAGIDFLRGGGLGYRDGQWRTGLPAARDSVVFADGTNVPVVRFAMPAVITIPRHVGVREVHGLLDATAGERVATASTLSAELIDRMPEGPSPESRREQRFTTIVEATGHGGRRVRATASGTDAYGTPAVIAVEAARRLVADGARPGVLAAAQAFDPDGFLAHLTKNGISWSLEL